MTCHEICINALFNKLHKGKYYITHDIMSHDMSLLQAKQIAANAYQFAQDHLLPDKLYCYFFTLLKVRSPDCHVQVRYSIQSYYNDALSCDLYTILYFNHVTSILYCILIMWLACDIVH